MNGLQVFDVYKSFGEKRALKGVSFELAQGEILALLGPSGCGKSTLLALIAGLEKADRGDIAWDGVSLAGMPPHRRNFGLMFQDYALFPHKNVYDNVAFGLQMAHMPVDQMKEHLTQILELTGLAGYERRDVNTLSGGEQQRVALARSLAPNPRLLMLDEPLGSLDRNLRERLLVDLQRILRHSRQTAIYVTHDQEEAFALADRVVVMNEGAVEQVGSPQEIYRRPGSVFVARFLGLDNLLPGRVISVDGKKAVETQLGNWPMPVGEPHQPGEVVTILLRPEVFQLERYAGSEAETGPVDNAPCRLTARLESVSFRGGMSRASVSVIGIRLSIDFPSPVELPKPGEVICLGFDPEQAIQVF